MRKDICHFSGHPIHPGHGKRYVPTLVNSVKPVLAFTTPKTRKLYLAKKNPRTIRWTVVFRRMNKKMVTAEEIRKRAKKTKKVQRAIVGCDLEQIRARRAPEVKAKYREAAMKELADRKAKTAEKKKQPKPQHQKQAPAAAKQMKKSGR